jgi:hypothetical protein
MSFGVDDTASDRKHIPAGCMNRPERTKSKKKAAERKAVLQRDKAKKAMRA